jgi:diguanylate cyclase (GGDEF)-like protein
MNASGGTSAAGAGGAAAGTGSALGGMSNAGAPAGGAPLGGAPSGGVAGMAGSVSGGSGPSSCAGRALSLASNTTGADKDTAHALVSIDLLTDLPNRGLFFDRLGQALNRGRRDGLSGALLFLDLDHFKEVNDQPGHAAGDDLLVTVAARLREQVRQSDTVARLGGDEFTVILPSLRDPNDAVRVGNNIIAAIGKPFDIAGKHASVGITIGIALFPQNGSTVEQVLKAADDAMYRAKDAGRNCYAFAAEEVVPKS